jgi:hypothetical protein
MQTYQAAAGLLLPVSLGDLQDSVSFMKIESHGISQSEKLRKAALTD